MKLSDYAKKISITHRTAWNWFKTGVINGAYQLSSGMIVVPDIADDSQKYGVILYARTSSSNNKELLDNQAK